MADEVEEFTRTYLGREMRFKMPTHGQLVMLQRIREQALRKAAGDDGNAVEELMSLSVRTMDFLESLFLDPKDVADVQAAMLLGEIDVEHLAPIMSGPEKPEKPAVSKTPGRKAPARKTARKAANPGRVAR